jgi:hypothetical protein
MDKRAAGEGFSWAAGLILIALIIIFAVFVSIAGKFGEKSVVIKYDSNIYSQEYQRVGVYAVLSDFNSSSKGKILSDVYSNNRLGYSGVANFLSLRIPNNYTYYFFPLSSALHFTNNFYLSCNPCKDKYLSFQVLKEGVNEK